MPTVALAGGCAGVVAVGGRIVVAIIFVPHLRAPFGLIRQYLFRIDDRAILRAQLLSELGGARRAYLGTLAAGNAFFRIDVRAVSGSGHVRRVEQLAGAQRIAGADAAVADTEDLILTVNVRDLMYKAVVLGALQDLHDFFARCRTGLVGLDGVGHHVADGDAHILFQMAAAFAADPAGTAAGAGADCTLAVVLIQPVRQMLQIDRFLFRWDRFFDRDDVHADAGTSGRHHGRDLFQRQAGHPLEHRRHFRVRRDRVQIHIHIFCAAGYEHGQHVLLVMIFVFPVVFNHTAQSQLFQQLFRACERFAALFGDFCCRDRYALVHDDGDFRHFIRHDVFQP